MSSALKNIIIGLIALILVVVAFVVYRIFFQFNENEIKIYAQEEANKYKDKAGVYSIILEGVQHVLQSHSLSQQVLKVSKSTGTDKEQILVQTAIGEAKARNYLPR